MQTVEAVSDPMTLVNRMMAELAVDDTAAAVGADEKIDQKKLALRTPLCRSVSRCFLSHTYHAL